MIASDSAKSELNLTDDERQRLTLAIASNYNYTGNESKIDDALQKLEDTSEPTTAQMNQFIVDEYQKSRFELEKLARQGDYQAQRNLAFGHATDPEVAGADRADGCAWYIVLYNSGSPEIVEDLDLANIKLYCSDKILNTQQKNKAAFKAGLLTKAIYGVNLDSEAADYL
tara:strand:+ start:7589 stop:8098 length:510 start_codon:yes stop_codon:yes gene_type:complete